MIYEPMFKIQNIIDFVKKNYFVLVVDCLKIKVTMGFLKTSRCLVIFVTLKMEITRSWARL